MGDDTDFAQLLNRMLGWLRFEFARRGNERHEREVNEGGIVATEAQTHLASRLEKRERFDIAYSATDFDNRYIRRTVPGLFRTACDEVLNFICDVRDHLNSFSKIIAASLFAQHRLVDLACGEIIDLAHFRGDKSLVVSEVQVSFGSVFGHEDFTMLKRTHGARINVDIRIEFEQGHQQATGFEDGGQRRGGNALA